MRRRGWAMAAAAAAAAAVMVAGGIPAAAGAGKLTFGDPAGDAGAGFDITSLTVSNDDAGLLTFRVALPALAAPPDNMAVLIALNGDPKGPAFQPDHLIAAIRGVAVMGPVTASGSPVVSRTVTTTFQPGALTVSVARRDLGNPRTLGLTAATFTLATDLSPITEANVDVVEASASARYTIALPTKLLVRSANLSPGRPVAGGRFRAGAFVRDVTYGAPGEPVSGGRVTCSFTVGGRKVTAARSLTKAGRATCAGAVPGDAAGATLRGTVTYTLDGVTVRRTFSTVVGG